MNKEFIPYEQALELKELGFDEPCMAFYELNNREVMVVGVSQRYNDPSLLTITDFCAPLYQQAFRWFREKFESTIHIYQYQDTQRWDFDVYDNTPEEEDFGNPSYDTYEEAELECLKKLIEIAKQLIADISQRISDEIDKMVVEEMIKIAKQK